MKKSLILAVAAVLVLGVSSVSFALLAGSVHDLVGVDGTTEICAVCHSPHDSGATRASNGPLWNHDLSSLSFTMYSSTNPNAETTPSVPGGNSRLCLGCHDGVTALTAFGGQAGGPTLVQDIDPNSKIPNLGGTDGDLRGTHPISIAYNATKVDSGLYPIASVTIGNTDLADILQLGNIECSTCHDVHNNTPIESTGTFLLRGSNAASAMCTSCHQK